ncbi:Methyltransferase [Candidatus Electrothrix laxa]
MSTILEHYDNLLADFYTWMFGDFDEQVELNEVFFQENGIRPETSNTAFDLGAGSGFQSIALAKRGFNVKAIDLCNKLIDELNSKKGKLDIETVHDDLLNFKKFISDKVQVIVCMGDTLTHLKSLDDVEHLLRDVYNSIKDDGQLILSFRDLTSIIHETDRFIPVKSDNNIIFTCFLEYEKEYVKVHDLVYEKKGEKWDFKKSYYKKIIIDPSWIKLKLKKNNFIIKYFSSMNGRIAIIAKKCKRIKRDQGVERALIQQFKE